MEDEWAEEGIYEKTGAVLMVRERTGIRALIRYRKRKSEVLAP
jgi:hypothetical protein